MILKIMNMLMDTVNFLEREVRYRTINLLSQTKVSIPWHLETTHTGTVDVTVPILWMGKLMLVELI